jgi:hypothetical protein
MIGAAIPTELVELARSVTDKLGAAIHAGGSPAYAQLIASELYEQLRLELKATPRSDPGKRGVLAAALDQCRRSVDPKLSPALRIAELRASLGVLERSAGIGVLTPPAPRTPAGPPRFRVIEGGLSRTG